MATITILNRPGETKARNIGPKGRETRMFEKSRKMTTLWEKAVVRPTTVDKLALFIHNRHLQLCFFNDSLIMLKQKSHCLLLYPIYDRKIPFRRKQYSPFFDHTD
ncbi:hypothetical protein [Pasteurella multocida]|uniref:hypothetical protein n=1 Tax=Pasteurella multocida TaxID=747 RepID=UPI0015A6725A|nr:hypothetical protein [Pasteurella multocida]MDC4235630.1 hypothetical protein [Pasteurella multocida]